MNVVLRVSVPQLTRAPVPIRQHESTIVIGDARGVEEADTHDCRSTRVTVNTFSFDADSVASRRIRIWTGRRRRDAARAETGQVMLLPPGCWPL